MKIFKIVLIIVSTIALTTLAIDASDTFSGKGGTLLSSLINYDNSVCPLGMVEVSSALTFSCVDKYELSAASTCTYTVPKNQFETTANLEDVDCKAEALPSAEPWRYITREQAALMCAKSGKRLASAEEWYQFAIGTPPDKCNINDGQVKVGSNLEECTSASGVVNAVGNVWEWVKDDIIDGVYQSRNLPGSGYVTQVDSGGVATVTDVNVSSDLFQQDYFWSNASGTYAMIRGGFYSSKSDAGVYSVHAHTLPTFTGNAVGFRCVK